MPLDLDNQARQLAAELESDIRGRGLASGDRYLTTAEASHMLGARRATVNRAMQLLAEREVLVRRRRVGAVVGPHMGRKKTRVVRLVKVVMPIERIATSGPLDDWVHGVHRSMPGIDVQFCFVPNEDADEYMTSIVTNASRVNATIGFILASCPRGIHSLVKRFNFPVVVAGSVYPEAEDLPSIDVDNTEVGRLLAGYAVEHGHRRIAFLAYEHWRPGDNLLLDGINARLTEAGLGPDSLRIRCLPSDKQLIEREAKRLLEHADRATAILGRNTVYAEAAMRAAASLGISVPDELLILSGDDGARDSESAEMATYPHIRKSVDYQRVVEIAGELLLKQFENERLEKKQIQISVELFDPESNS